MELDSKVQTTKDFFKSKCISEFILDETLFIVGTEYTWLWIAIIEPRNDQILALLNSKAKNMFVADRFISN
jgi:transposase-like protein